MPHVVAQEFVRQNVSVQAVLEDALTVTFCLGQARNCLFGDERFRVYNAVIQRRAGVSQLADVVVRGGAP